MPNGQRLMHVVADRIQWQTALEQARRRAAEARPFGNRQGSMSAAQREVRADDPFAGLPLLIPVPQAAKLIGISRARSCRSEEDDERHEWRGGKPTRTAGSASDRGPEAARQGALNVTRLYRLSLWYTSRRWPTVPTVTTRAWSSMA